MKSYPKHKRWKSPKYLEYVRQQPCLICGAKQSQAHHHQTKNNHGTALKPGDYWCIPLCLGCHQMLHFVGKKTFFKRHRIDVFQEIFRMISGYLKKQ